MAHQQDASRMLQTHSVILQKLNNDVLTRIGVIRVDVNVTDFTNVSTLALPEHPNYPLQVGQRFLLVGQTTTSENGLYEYDGTDLVKQVELGEQLTNDINNLRAEIFEKTWLKETQAINIASTLTELPSFSGYTLQEGEKVILLGQTNTDENGIYFYDATTNLLVRDPLLATGDGLNITDGTLNLNIKNFTDTETAVNLLTKSASGVSAIFELHPDTTNLTFLEDPTDGNKRKLYLNTSGLGGGFPALNSVVFSRTNGLAETGFTDKIDVTVRGENFGNNAEARFPNGEFTIDLVEGYTRSRDTGAGEDVLEFKIIIDPAQSEGLKLNVLLEIVTNAADDIFAPHEFDFTFEKLNIPDFVKNDARIDAPLTDPEYNYFANGFLATISLGQSHHVGIQDFTITPVSAGTVGTISQNSGTQDLIFEITPNETTNNFLVDITANSAFTGSVTKRVDLLRAGNYVDELVEWTNVQNATASTGQISHPYNTSQVIAETTKQLMGKGEVSYTANYNSDDVCGIGLTNVINTWKETTRGADCTHAIGHIYQTNEIRFYENEIVLSEITSSTGNLVKLQVGSDKVEYFRNSTKHETSNSLPASPSVVAVTQHRPATGIYWGVDLRDVRIKGDWETRTI